MSLDNIMTVKIEFRNGGNTIFHDVIELDTLSSYRTTDNDGKVVISTGYIRVKQINGRETMFDNFSDVSLIAVYKSTGKKIKELVQGVM